MKIFRYAKYASMTAFIGMAMATTAAAVYWGYYGTCPAKVLTIQAQASFALAAIVEAVYRIAKFAFSSKSNAAVTVYSACCAVSVYFAYRMFTIDTYNMEMTNLIIAGLAAGLLCIGSFAFACAAVGCFFNGRKES